MQQELLPDEKKIESFGGTFFASKQKKNFFTNFIYEMIPTQLFIFIQLLTYSRVKLNSIVKKVRLDTSNLKELKDLEVQRFLLNKKWPSSLRSWELYLTSGRAYGHALNFGLGTRHWHVWLYKQLRLWRVLLTRNHIYEKKNSKKQINK